ncbi:MAG TPA: hypothetical protein VGR47_20355 [Terracidiphilus sp.]|nr:hypothetical protein [Terracidiphilus sp.]
MRAQLVAAGVLFAVAGAYPVFGQALAEGALVHANAGAAGAKVGTALGNALNKATTQLGQQMQTVTQTHVAGTPQSVPHTAAAASGSNGSAAASSSSLSSSSSGGSMIVSVKGGPPSNKAIGQPKCAPASPAEAGNNASSGTAPQTQSCAAPAVKQNGSKSAVTLSISQ